MTHKNRKPPLRARGGTPVGRRIDRTLNKELPPMLWLATDGEVRIERDLGCFHDSERDCWLPVLTVKAQQGEKRETVEELLHIRETLCDLSKKNADAWVYIPTIDQFDPAVQLNPLSKTSREGLRLAQFQIEARRVLLRMRIVDEVARKQQGGDGTTAKVRETFAAIFDGYRARATQTEDQHTIDALRAELDQLVEKVMAHKPCFDCGKPFIPPSTEDRRCSFHKKDPNEKE